MDQGCSGDGNRGVERQRAQGNFLEGSNVPSLEVVDGYVKETLVKTHRTVRFSLGSGVPGNLYLSEVDYCV